MLATALIINF